MTFIKSNGYKEIYLILKKYGGGLYDDGSALMPMTLPSTLVVHFQARWYKNHFNFSTNENQRYTMELGRTLWDSKTKYHRMQVIAKISEAKCRGEVDLHVLTIRQKQPNRVTAEQRTLTTKHPPRHR